MLVPLVLPDPELVPEDVAVLPELAAPKKEPAAKDRLRLPEPPL